MTDDIKDILERYINDSLILAVASNPQNKAEGLATKVRIRPVRVKGRLLFQAAMTVGAQEMHENADAAGMIKLIGDMTDDGPRFGQLELKNAAGNATVLISRKGHVTVKESRTKDSSVNKGGISIPADTIGGPDRRKNYIIPEGTPVPFLVELGVTNKDGYVVKARYDKFRQINRYLEFVDDVMPQLVERGKNRDGRLSIIDFGCGKSYLTFALYHFLHESKGMDVHITGLDLKKSVIAECADLAKKLGYNDLEFKHGDIADYETSGGVDMVVTLHACDTATDYALYNAIRWNAAVIMCVPCCQHELNKQIHSEELKPVLKYGIIKERISALITDSMRAGMLEEQGYTTQILEFIDMEHTPKNLLIRAVKRDKPVKMPVGKNTGGYEKLLESFGADLTLHRLLRNGK